MNFQKEYEILNLIKSDKILEIAFTFRSHKIKVYFSKRESSEFLVLICENDKYSFVKNYGIYFKNGNAIINGYWDIYYKYAKGLKNTNDNGFSEFYSKPFESIHNVNNPSHEFSISYLENNSGLQKIKNLTRSSVFSDEPIYFNHIRRQPISTNQFDRVSKYIGKDVAIYLRRNNLNAVFTSDISKQKTFILP